MHTQVYPLPETDLAQIGSVIPDQLQWQRYVIRGIGSAEEEEAAARLLELSIRAAQWTGASWRQILAIREGDLSDMRAQIVTVTIVALSLLEGLDVLGRGFGSLQKRGLIRIEIVGVEEVIFPTSLLILHATGAQPLAPS